MISSKRLDENFQALGRFFSSARSDCAKIVKKNEKCSFEGSKLNNNA